MRRPRSLRALRQRRPAPAASRPDYSSSWPRLCACRACSGACVCVCVHARAHVCMYVHTKHNLSLTHRCLRLWTAAAARSRYLSVVERRLARKQESSLRGRAAHSQKSYTVISSRRYNRTLTFQNLWGRQHTAGSVAAPGPDASGKISQS